MNKQKNLLILALIFILALSLRLAFVHNVPWGINADEAAFGYNGYSFLKTGRDEWNKFPLYIKSFGEYKLPGYFWFSLPFIWLLGLKIISIRLASILAGSLLPIIIYYLLKKLKTPPKLSFLTAFSLAVMPIAIHFSRAGFEANLALFFLTLAALVWLEDKKIASFLFMFLAFYTYNSVRILLPFFLVLLYFIDYKSEKKFYSFKKSFLIVSIFYLSFITGLIINPHLMARFKGLSFWQQPGFDLTQRERLIDYSTNHLLIFKLIHNKASQFIKTLVSNYFNHFRFDFLFFKGDPVDRLSFPKSGLVSFWQIPFVLIGFLVSFLSYRKTSNLIFLSLFFLAPLASATTFQTPSIIRSLLLIVPLAYFSALGLVKFYRFSRQKFSTTLTLIGLLLFFIYPFAFNLHNYFADYDHFRPQAFQPGYQEMVTKMEKYENGFSKVVITKAYGQPYIFLLFFKKYNPNKYHQLKKEITQPDKFGFLTVNHFDKYYFIDQLNWATDCTPGTLCIGTARELNLQNPHLKILDLVYHQNKKDIIFVLATKK